MATWNSRGLRGSLLEEMINLTNEKYRAKQFVGKNGNPFLYGMFSQPIP